MRIQFRKTKASILFSEKSANCHSIRFSISKNFSFFDVTKIALRLKSLYLSAEWIFSNPVEEILKLYYSTSQWHKVIENWSTRSDSIHVLRLSRSWISKIQIVNWKKHKQTQNGKSASNRGRTEHGTDFSACQSLKPCWNSYALILAYNGWQDTINRCHLCDSGPATEIWWTT